ncbi:DNA ligase 1-like [Acropora muricata]|uniref:DNA ligase 1-like n=1 Tax=Acropora muricata TaxID=159855 RepID=UPI0034E45E79
MSRTVEEEEKTIGNKLKVLKLTHKGSDKIVGTKSLKQIQRHRKLLESKLEECHEIKARAQELKLERGDEEDDIRAWSAGIEKSLEEYERAVEGLEELERSLREQERREIQEEEERSRWEIKKKFAAKADEKDSDAAGSRPS